MASSSTALCKNTTKKISHLKYLITNQSNELQAVTGFKNKKAAGLCTRINMLSKWPHIILTKRKLCSLTVVASGLVRSAEKFNHGPGNVTSCPAKASSLRHCGQNSCTEESDLGISRSKNVSAFVPLNNFGLTFKHFNPNGNKTFSYLDHSRSQGRTIRLTSPIPLVNCQNVRHFSKRRRYVERREENDEEDEEQKRQIKAAVMYVSNPVTWVSKKWNIARLRHNLDPDFSESEFLVGARQAVSQVTQKVSSGHFDQLTGLVEEEAIDWLMSRRNSLASMEREALALNVGDVVLIKLQYLHVDVQQEKPVAFGDVVCFGLRILDKVPFLVNVGIRFRREYSTDPPGNWVVADLSHIHVENLAEK